MSKKNNLIKNLKGLNLKFDQIFRKCCKKKFSYFSAITLFLVHPVLASFKKKIKICYLSTRLPAGGKFFYLEFNCQAGQRRGGGLRPTRLNKGRGLINNLYLTLLQGGGCGFFRFNSKTFYNRTPKPLHFCQLHSCEQI